MALQRSFFWRKNPFIKLFIALAAGIALQWNHPLPSFAWIMAASAGILILLLLFWLPFFRRYQLSFLSGTGMVLAISSAGGLLVLSKDIRNSPNWFGHHYKPGDAVIASLEEPLVEKTKSLKADAKVHFILHDGKAIPVRGRIIIYFRKDSATPGAGHLYGELDYGSQIILRKNIQEIKNSGNPGGFDYKRYSVFKGITHQAFIRQKEFEIIPGRKINALKETIYAARKRVLNILRKNIPGEKETGLAEALLIGYKDDLEQPLVQSYTNTGVVHIIAISGLHIGLIYWLLAFILKPISKKRNARWLKPLLIITGLWAFSLLAGAQPSVLRSALMFTFIVLGETLNRKTSVYNSMAVSAFLLLCINPFWLWDVGFQLSYAAVLSIIIFMRPVYNLFYFKNKILDFTWKLNAVTLAAQVLTLPLSIYHFHQFPAMFMLSNFLAVPLSCVILFAEIFLCIISFIPAIALLTGEITAWLIRLMNTYVENVELIPGSLWDGLQITIVQVILLILFTAGISRWLLEKEKKGLVYGLLAMLGFFIARSFSFAEAEQQKKIVVYNVPQKRAIDFINGRKFFFTGDSDLLQEGFARNFHLKPSRILMRTSRTDKLRHFTKEGNYIQFGSKRIMLIDKSTSFQKSAAKQTVDLLVISKNPKLYFKHLVPALDIKQVVFDGSAPAWKVKYWKKDCDSLKIPWHDVTAKGAFVMTAL